MEQQQPRKYVLRTTCTKNGGFQKYQPLPPQEVFQHAFWVLGTEMDVKIKRKQRFFNRKTDWMFLPVYLTANKGLLFVYVKKDSGYILRVSSALTLNFEGNKKYNKQKNNRRQSKTQPDFTYDATIILHFQFGELRLRFKNDENLRSWRALLLAAHHTQYGVTKIGENVAKQIFPSTSLESVVSTKSVYPEVDEKDKTEKVQVYRHPMIAPAPPPRSVVNVEEKAAAASAFTLPSPILGSSVYSESGTGTSSYIKSANDGSSLLDRDNEKIGAQLNKSFMEQDVQHVSKNPFSPAYKTSKSHLTSEVNVSFEDLDPVSATSFTPASSSSARRPQYRVSFAQTPPSQIQSHLSEIRSNESVLDQDEEGEKEYVSNNNPFSPKTSKSHLTSEVNVSFGDLEPVSASETSITAASSTCSRPPGHVSVTQSPPPLQRQVRFEDFEPVTSSSYVRPPPTPYVPRRNYSLRETQSSDLLQEYKELLSRKEKQPSSSLRALSFRNQTEIPSTLPRNAFPKPHPIQIETSPQHSKVFEFWRKKDQNESLT